MSLIARKIDFITTVKLVSCTIPNVSSETGDASMHLLIDYEMRVNIKRITVFQQQTKEHTLLRKIDLSHLIYSRQFRISSTFFFASRVFFMNRAVIDAIISTTVS